MEWYSLTILKYILLSLHYPLRLPTKEFQIKHMKYLLMLCSHLSSAKELKSLPLKITTQQVLTLFTVFSIHSFRFINMSCVINVLDIIMDMLEDKKMRMIISQYYEESGEPELVRKAVDEAWHKEKGFNAQSDDQGTLSAKLNLMRYILCTY